MKYQKLKAFTYWLFGVGLLLSLLYWIFGSIILGETAYKDSFEVVNWTIGILLGGSAFANWMLHDKAVAFDKKICAGTGELSLVDLQNAVLKSWPISCYNTQNIGTEFTCPIRLKESALQVEKNHAAISYINDVWYVKNIAQRGTVDVISNTIVTLTQGQTHKLETGYILQIGKARLYFTSHL